MAVLLLGIEMQFQLARHIDPAAATGSDFLAFYTGAKLLPSGEIYSLPAARGVARTLTDKDEYYPFIRPPWFAALLRPFAWLPPGDALFAWRVLMALAIVGFALLWPTPVLANLAAAACSFPVFSSLLTGQDMPLILLWLAAALRLFRRGRWFAAGLAASLCTLKFHLFALALIVIVTQRLWRFAAGLLAGAAALFAISLAIMGRWWVSDYLGLILHPATNPHVDSMYDLRGACAILGLPWFCELALAGCAGILVWRIARHSAPLAAFCAALAGGILAGHHSYLGDLILLLPACLSLLFQTKRRWLQAAILFLLFPVPYLLVPNPIFIPVTVFMTMLVLFGSALASPAVEAYTVQAEGRNAL